MPRVLRPKPTDLSREASTAVLMRMEWGKCRADTRSSHTQHVRRIALDTEREGRAPCPIRPPADPRLDTDLPAHHLQTMHLVTCAQRTTSRAAGRARLHALPAPSSRPPQPAVPAEGRRRHAAGPPAHTRVGECRALIGSGAEEGAGHRSPAQAAASGPERGEAAPPPRWPRAASLRDGGHRPLPARPPFPPISTCAPELILSSSRSATPVRRTARRQRPVFGNTPEPAAPVVCGAASAPCSLPRPSPPPPAPSS